MLAQSRHAIPPPYEWWRSIGRWLGFPKPVDSDANAHAKIVPTLDASIHDDENLAWCGTLQLAWNQGRACFGGKPIKLDPPSALADSLNHQQFDIACVDADSVFTACGPLDAGIVDQLKTYLRKIGVPESRVLGPDGLWPGLDEFICYARLDKNLKFPTPYGSLGYRALDGRKVPCFGYLKDTRNANEARKQTLIHHYESPQDFIIELQTRDSADMLLLAKAPPAAVLGEMVRTVVDQLHAAPIFAGGNDVLIVPCITFSSTESFAELQGRRIVEHAGWFMKSAMQAIDFKMNEKGVILHSEANISFARSLAAVAQHVMVLEPPFLIVMKRKDATEPYFAAWIANTDLLKRS